MTMPPPGWYPDQHDQRFSRWWDGRGWTQNVQPRPPRGEPLLTVPVLVMKKEYLDTGGIFNGFACEIVDEAGTRIGSLGRVELDEAAQRGRIFSGDSQEGLGLTEHYQLHDAQGRPVVHIARAIRMKNAAKPLFELSLADGTPIGYTQSEKLFGRTITWGFTTPHRERVGGFTSRSMTGPFTVTDQGGTQLAEFARTGDRLNTDGYVLRRPVPVPPPLGWFVLVGMMAFDIGVFGNERSSAF
jgi:Protein of unknown function (DUF2510)